MHFLSYNLVTCKEPSIMILDEYCACIGGYYFLNDTDLCEECDDICKVTSFTIILLLENINKIK